MTEKFPNEAMEQREEIDLERRRVLRVLAMSAAAATAISIYDNPANAQARVANPFSYAANIPPAPLPSKPLFFDAEEMRAIAAISDLIIPTDDHSPGAVAAKVPAFIDLMVSVADEGTKRLWRDGIAAVDRLAIKRFKGRFAELQPAQQIELLKELAKNEFKPAAEQTLEERFFRAIKTLTIDGYYTSEIGIHQDLQYQGNRYQKEFLGCAEAKVLGLKIE
ncbi:MAG: hypothetical protein C4334_11335 [Pyrinomonas sp.]|uniref:gluconate 2-dehydrogenase subunit 3 family protein n=1 Tax=Pyrinomonas sp. TaxID=2080306 RepID=UPI00332144BF